MNNDPHAGQPIGRRGPDPASARLAVVLVHGRGASAADILSLAEEFGVHDVAYLAPEACGSSRLNPSASRCSDSRRVPA